jgi:DNA-binding beta-propeller fold protein YncE
MSRSLVARPRAASALAALAASGLLGCGESGLSFAVTLGLPARAGLSPTTSAVGLERVEIFVAGTERGVDATVIGDATLAQATFSGIPEDTRLAVIARGYDALGNLVGYGERRAVDPREPLTLSFRRPLGYVAHAEVCGGGCGAGVCARIASTPFCDAANACIDTGGAFACTATTSGCEGCGAGSACILESQTPRCVRTYAGTSRAPATIYAFDTADRSFVEAVTIPGTRPRAIAVSAVGGEAVWVTWSDEPEGSDDRGGRAARLSTSDHTWSPVVRTGAPFDLVIGSPTQDHAVGGRSGELALIDVVAGSVLRRFSTGGRVLDGAVGGPGGRIALLATSSGLVSLELDRANETQPVVPGELVGASGVAVDETGDVAYVASSVERSLVALDLVRGGATPIASCAGVADACIAGFAAPVTGLAYASTGQALFAIRDAEQRVLAYDLLSRRGAPSAQGIGIYERGAGIAAGPDGLRVALISTGTSSLSSGLTMLDATLPPTGSSLGYFGDPLDGYTERGQRFRQRYQPRSLTILHGH